MGQKKSDTDISEQDLLYLACLLIHWDSSVCHKEIEYWMKIHLLLIQIVEGRRHKVNLLPPFLASKLVEISLGFHLY